MTDFEPAVPPHEEAPGLPSHPSLPSHPGNTSAADPKGGG